MRALARNNRGEAYARNLYPAAMRTFQGDLATALDLVTQAIAADPNLVSASDLFLLTAPELGKAAEIADSVCKQDTKANKRCASERFVRSEIDAVLFRVLARGACTKDATMSTADLPFSPMAIGAD